jgi:tripartite-type tricarboxylate transporter receptor subunit TctC
MRQGRPRHVQNPLQPTPSINIIVPFSAGSATDITARTVFDQVGKQIGQTIVIENRGGAGTTLGAGASSREYAALGCAAVQHSAGRELGGAAANASHARKKPGPGRGSG